MKKKPAPKHKALTLAEAVALHAEAVEHLAKSMDEKNELFQALPEEIEKRLRSAAEVFDGIGSRLSAAARGVPEKETPEA